MESIPSLPYIAATTLAALAAGLLTARAVNSKAASQSTIAQVLSLVAIGAAFGATFYLAITYGKLFSLAPAGYWAGLWYATQRHSFIQKRQAVESVMKQCQSALSSMLAAQLAEVDVSDKSEAVVSEVVKQLLAQGMLVTTVRDHNASTAVLQVRLQLRQTSNG